MSVKAEHTISWSIRPEKKSINFGIFKHPGHGNAPIPKSPSATFELPPTPGLRPADEVPQELHSSRTASSTVTEKLKSIGLKPIIWYGTLEANKVSTGRCDVPSEEGGMYALVFDNTFAKSFAKSATFVLLTYPTSAPPQLNHHQHHIQGASESSASLKETLSSRRIPLQRHSSDSVHQLGLITSKSGSYSNDSRNKVADESETGTASNAFRGVLQKRRRKKHQGWARRYFSLDYSSSTLSYYQNRNTRAVRGAVPLSLAAIGTNAKTRQISIDSGAEIWHLKAANSKDFDAWKQALEVARAADSPDTSASVFGLNRSGPRLSVTPVDFKEEKEWKKVEDIVQQVKDTRDVAKSLAKDTDPKYLILDIPKPPFARTDSNSISSTSSVSGSPSELNGNNGFFNDGERKSFWKRKSSRERPVPGMYRSVSATPTSSIPPTPIRTTSFAPESRPLQSHPEEQNVHDRCMSLLRNLDSIVADFGLLIGERKQRRTPLTNSTSRYSIDTQGSDEYFDAEGITDSQLLNIHHESDDEGDADDHGFASDHDSASASDIDEPSGLIKRRADTAKSTPAFPPRPRSLAPLPIEPVKRRKTVSAPTVAPPSLIGFLRKNVGKDLSTISMPVSANEPISLLQRIAEIFEYSNLLDQAALQQSSSVDRLIYVTAFAISNLSSARVKDRSIRKPFNPLLGETFELVREDRGLRFVAEKVSHRPVRMACQAESENWTLTQSPLPTQKFWGKSAELMTEGKFRITLHSTGDRFSWCPATSFLRNIIAGEKYVEPVGTMCIINEITGEKAVVTFKVKGMFSGRSEEVEVETYDSYGDRQPLGLTGKWTSSLTVTDNGQPRDDAIWTVAELVPDASKRYGFTTFASSLNEITPIEKGKLPPTDSRLRPDQRAAEDGELDNAETLKAQLEEAQRQRRKTMEEECKPWKPKWFDKIDGADGGEEVWVAKVGKDNYWAERTEGQWSGIEKIFELDY